MNTTQSLSRFNVQSLFQYRVVSTVAAVVFVLIVGLMSTNVFAADEAINNDVCATSWTHVALEKNDVISVYSGSVAGAPNGFLVSQFDLSEIPGITDEQRASNSIVWLVSDESEVEGWTTNLYWYQDHYGATVTGTVLSTTDGITSSSSFSDDTGASCAL